MIGVIAIAALAVVTTIAIVVAALAVRRTRVLQSALAASEAAQIANAERERKIEASSRLAGDVAHDLNDLLTAITGHTELLIASLDPSSAAIQDAREIRRAALSAARLTKPLRALSGGNRRSTEVIDVNAVTSRTVSSLERMLGAGTAVTLTLDPGIKRIKVGASDLEEIVLNLGVHARDAMPNGGRLTIATAMHYEPADGGGSGAREYVRMIASDTGGGLSAAEQARLFEPFLASAEAGEIALGLAKVNAIVKQSGGRIRVDSAPGAGTTFTIDLPATSEAAAADAAPGEPRLTAPVLVVEDEPRVCEFIRLVLVRAGHEVVAVAGPRAALAALNRQPEISLMLVDVVMPEMDGYDLVAEARRVSPGVQVVFMSGFAPDLTRAQSGDAFLAKPFTVESLTSIVETTLAAR